MITHSFGQAVQEGLLNACDSTSSDLVNIMESCTNEDKLFESLKEITGQPKQRGLSRKGQADETLSLAEETVYWFRYVCQGSWL